MEFNTPTTKEQMYVILNDLYHYYRIRRKGFEELNLKELELERMAYVPLTDEQLLERATLLLAPEHQREKDEYSSAILNEISDIEKSIANAESALQEEIADIRKRYDESIIKLNSQAEKSGLFHSDLAVNKRAQLEAQMNADITAVTTKKEQTVANYSAKKQVLEEKLLGVEEKFRLVHELDTTKKFNELKYEQEALTRQVFEYNNALDEKEQRYANTIKQTQASLEIRFLDVTSGEFTKDQLVDMGYYEDVINCVCGYYDTLDALTAYRDIGSEKKLMIYLDDYYESVIYLYKSLAI